MSHASLPSDVRGNAFRLLPYDFSLTSWSNCWSVARWSSTPTRTRKLSYIEAMCMIAFAMIRLTEYPMLYDSLFHSISLAGRPCCRASRGQNRSVSSRKGSLFWVRARTSEQFGQVISPGGCAAWQGMRTNMTRDASVSTKFIILTRENVDDDW